MKRRDIKIWFTRQDRTGQDRTHKLYISISCSWLRSAPLPFTSLYLHRNRLCQLGIYICVPVSNTRAPPPLYCITAYLVLPAPPNYLLPPVSCLMIDRPSVSVEYIACPSRALNTRASYPSYIKWNPPDLGGHTCQALPACPAPPPIYIGGAIREIKNKNQYSIAMLVWKRKR